jgi:hypothetical protein
VAKTIFNELYQALNMKKIMKKNPLRKCKFPCPFFISIVMLTTKSNLPFLCQNDVQIFGDGTFQYCAIFFDQL